MSETLLTACLGRTKKRLTHEKPIDSPNVFVYDVFNDKH